MAVILISGGTGLIGKALCASLIKKGHEVRVLSRQSKSNNAIKYYHWNVEKAEIDEKAFQGISHLVHLAGEGIGDKRWNEKRKKQIIDSRVNSMTLLESVLVKHRIRLKAFVGASAIGIYGMQTVDKIFTENDIGTDDFLSHTCRLWEGSYSKVADYSECTCVIRTGIVLSEHGGVLERMLPFFKLGLGSAMGSGKQYMPWIHVNDLIRIYEEALFNSGIAGVYNAVSGQHIDNSTFSKSLAKAFHRPFFMPKVPAFLLKFMYGEMAEMLLTGSRVTNEKLLNNGFSFNFANIDEALKNIASVK